ncbi:MAG: serine/threonine-protein kinase [Isosphaeraceae bacterium]|jgi:serine/threonine-protein kinase
MNQPDAKADDPSRGRRPATNPLPESFAPDRQVIEGGSTELADETRNLLHRRLRAASLMLALGFGIFLLRDFYFPKILQNLIYLHGLVFLLLVVNVLALSGRWTPSMRQLRLLELATFGSVAGFFVASQSLGLQARVQQDLLTGAELRVLFKNSIIGTLILMLTYGIFIPNNWRRATLAIVPMALAPLVAPLLLGLTSPSFRSVSEEARTFDKITENSLYLVLGAVTAVFGTHTINTFRKEEFRARRLNQYHLTKKLGAGGMGEVYLAEHQLLKRPCAVKLIRPSLSQKPRVLARFELEVRATARLSHWNTVEVFDYGRTEDGTFYYVMEYLPGLSLQELVDRHGPLPPGRIIYLLCQACDALREAHQAGLIHRDLKPPNIFAAYRGARYDVAKLLDFGLVKPIKEEDSPVLTREGTVTGSPLYMAPEQIMRTHAADRRTDIYAMGAIAYFLLTGRPPFLGNDSMAVMVAHARDPVVPPSRLRDDVPGDLEMVVLRCLEKKPEDRYQDAESLALSLSACADGGSWSAVQAEAWWREHESGALVRAVESASSDQVTGPTISLSDLTRADVDAPTFGASVLEAASEPGSSGGIELSLSLGEEETRPER